MTELQKEIINKYILEYQEDLSSEELEIVINDDEDIREVFYEMVPKIMDEYLNRVIENNKEIEK